MARSELGVIADTASIDNGNSKSAFASNPTQRPKLSAYHNIHPRLVTWQQENDSHETPNHRP